MTVLPTIISTPIIVLTKSLQLVVRICANAIARFYWEDGFSRAAALAYSTLLALVPIAALTISFLSTFGIGRDQALNAVKYILETLLPARESGLIVELQEQIFSFLEALNTNVSDLNTLTIVVLIITSVFLLITIQSALNDVWRVTSNTSIVSKVLNYWAVITLAFLLIAVSIVWTTKVQSLPEAHPILNSQWWATVNLMLPTMVTWLALSVLFFRMPAAPVRLRDAAFGGFIAAILFEGLKRGFSYYIARSTTYSALYGILASIPLFLFWLYLIWVVILIGAHISYQAGSVHLWKGLRKYATDLGEIGAVLGLRVLSIIGARFLQGEQPPSEGDLAVETGSDPVLVRACLDVLTEASMLTAPDDKTHARTLNVSPSKLTIGEIRATFLSKAERRMLTKRDSAKVTAAEEVEALEQGGLLDQLRIAGQKIDKTKTINEWTLEEFVAANN